MGMWVALLACLGHQRVPTKFVWKSSLDLGCCGFFLNNLL